jgi:hypothetical protein
VLETYLLFDADGSGTIDKDEVMQQIREKAAATASGEAGANSLLQADRWAELDWDDDGQISFKEFLWAFYEWVGIDDESDDEEEAAPRPDESASQSAVLSRSQEHSEPHSARKSVGSSAPSVPAVRISAAPAGVEAAGTLDARSARSAKSPRDPVYQPGPPTQHRPSSAKSAPKQGILKKPSSTQRMPDVA